MFIFINRFNHLSGKLLQLRARCSRGDKLRFSDKRIFSGIQPTGSVHLGNYFGAIKQWVNFQNADENVTYCIVDMHSITLPQNRKELPRNILEMTATLLACGIDPDKAVLYQQSRVRQHTELCWYLACICTMARLAHLPQYKEKSATLKDIPLGLFIYPVLQAADILIHKATHVPVGEDQAQHIELAQTLAKMFNSRNGATFPIPHMMVLDGVARLRSLRDPLKKMSKSDGDPKSRICLTDSSDEIFKKIKKCVTDSNSKITYDLETRPGVSNLILITSALEGKTPEEVCKDAENFDTLQFKHKVADIIISHVSPISEKIKDYLSDPDYLINVLKKGAEKASIVAEKTMKEVEEKVGIELKVASLRKSQIN